LYASNDEVGRINDMDRRTQLLAIATFNSLVLLIAFARVVLLPKLPFKREELTIVYFSLISYFALLLLAEVQPRYSIFLIFGFSLWCGFLPLAKPSDFGRPREWRPRFATSLVVIGLLGVAFLSGAQLLQRFVLGFMDLSGATVLAKSEAPMLSGGPAGPWLPAVVDARFNRVGLLYPAREDIEAGTTMGVRLDVEVPSSSLELFLTTLPKQFRMYHDSDDKVLRWADFGVSYCLYINDQEYDCRRVTDYGSRFLSVGGDHLGESRPVSLKLVVRNSVPIEAGALPAEPVIVMEYLRYGERLQ
jgi:hypothetical protein